MGAWPTGTVTFLFTDLEGSTRLWEESTVPMRSALARHDAILRDAVALAHSELARVLAGGGGVDRPSPSSDTVPQ